MVPDTTLQHHHCALHLTHDCRGHTDGGEGAQGGHDRQATALGLGALHQHDAGCAIGGLCVRVKRAAQIIETAVSSSFAITNLSAGQGMMAQPSG